VASVLPQAGAVAGFAVLMLLLAGALAGRRRTT